MAASKVAKKVGNDSLRTLFKAKVKLIENSVNHKAKAEIDKMFKADQKVRTNKHLKSKKIYYDCINDSLCDMQSKKFINAMLDHKLWLNTDSINSIKLKDFFARFGFPDESLIGVKSAFNAYIIILHYDSDNDNKIMKPVLDQALSECKINPREYAHIIDRRLILGQNIEPYYYEIPIGLETLTPDKITEINLRRAEIGLPGVMEGRKIIKKKKYIKVVNTK